MKLIGIVVCICIIMVAVECRPVKRADAPPVTASEGNSRGRIGTTYTVTLVTDTGSASGEGEMQPDFEDVSLADLTLMLNKIFGEEWMKKHAANP